MGLYMILSDVLDVDNHVFLSQSLNSCLPDVSNVDCDPLTVTDDNVSTGDRSDFAPVVDFDTCTHDSHDHDIDNAEKNHCYDLRPSCAPRVTTGWS